LEGHLKALANGLHLDINNQKSGLDLFAIFQASNPPSMPQSQSAGGSSAEESFKKYLELLNKRGYFNGTTEGTPDYETRLEKARTRFFAKFSNSEASEKQQVAPANPYANLSPEERASKGEEHKNKGNSLLNSQKYEEAINEYNIAISCIPDNAIFYANRGFAYQKMNKHESAINDLNEAIKYNPKYTKAHLRLGTSYLAINDYKSASKIISDGLSIEPGNNTLIQLQQEIEQRIQSFQGGAEGGPPNPMFPGMGAFPGMGGAGMQNMMELMNNPEFMNMAAQMMQNNPELVNMARQIAENPNLIPQLMNQLPNFMGNPGGPGGPGGPAGTGGPGGPTGTWNDE